MPLSERDTSPDLSEYGNKFLSEEEVKQEALRRLRIKYPNLAHISGDWYGTKTIIERSSDLLALVETFQLEERLFEIAIHGSNPVIYLILDPSVDPESNSYQVGRIYHYDHGKNYPPSYQTEGWDPKILNIPGKSVGMGNYVIGI